MERSNRGRGRGRVGGGAGSRGGSASAGRTGSGRGRAEENPPHYHQQQQYHNQQLHRQGGSGGGGGGGGRGWSRGGGPPYQPPPPQQWSRPVHSPGQGQGQPQPQAEASSSIGRGRGGGAWGGSTTPRAWTPSPAPAPAQTLGPVYSSGSPSRSPSNLPGMHLVKLIPCAIAIFNQRKIKSELVPVRRPDKGGKLAIWSPKLLVNHFRVGFNPRTVVIHYDIDIKLEDPSKNRPTKISKSDLRMIKNKLFSDDPSKFPLSRTAYDGEKNIFSAVPLPTGKFKVDLSDGEDGNSRSYAVTIKAVSELRFDKLSDYLKGEIISIPRDVLQGMDLVIKENPSRCRIPMGKSFYSPIYNDNDDLGGGIVALKGFQQSLKPTSQGLALCLDYSVLAFRKPLPVIEFLRQHVLGHRGVDQLARLKREVNDALKGLKVTVTHRTTKQKYTISGLTDRNTRDISFDMEDPEAKAPPRRVSLVQYFREKYDKQIMHLDIPCLDVGKNNRKNYVPMEFCVLMEGQRFPKEQLDRDGSSALKNMSLLLPRLRMRNINEMVIAEDGPCGGGLTQNFGLEVVKNMTKVQGRVIGPPQLKLRAQNGKITSFEVDQENCQWNLVRKSVVEGKAMAPPLLQRAADMRVFSDINRLRNLLKSVIHEAHNKGQGRLQIIVCVMSRVDPGYKSLKWLTETEIGIVTQCCLSQEANKAKDQYLANLALKINAKLGGSNVELVERLPRFEGERHVMFVGVDVNHPAARNSTCPSMAAVVASMNWPAANCYAARVCPQYHRKETVLNFGIMCKELIQSYARINKERPRRIVVFRDGVSEGQFDMVLNEELLDLKKTICEENYKPTITLVVAQKRHQTRLFPQTQQDGSAKGNVPPGTVVDTVITHPFEFDFYLCSHYGSIGTSKPTHYYVLWDENGFTSDQLQKLIYDLCFTFARCTKPVSLVPPVYYADLVAYRGRMFQEVVMMSPPASSSMASTSSSVSASFDQNLYKLHPELENIMFFV
ncbi:hypothetical protein NMG60_11015221 [Bertholletia excelsa]